MCIIHSMTIAELRKEYTAGGITEEDAGDDPFALFHRWFHVAMQTGLPDPNAMTLATVFAVSPRHGLCC